LPLSRSPQLGGTMGTRHRAALGLSEETDAVILVVSEESGRISLALAGRIEIPLDHDALRRRLAELFSLEAAPPLSEQPWWEPARGWLRKGGHEPVRPYPALGGQASPPRRPGRA